MGTIYDRSKAIAVIANIAFTAIGLANSNSAGRMLNRLVNQIALIGVRVTLFTRPK